MVVLAAAFVAAAGCSKDDADNGDDRDSATAQDSPSGSGDQGDSEEVGGPGSGSTVPYPGPTERQPFVPEVDADFDGVQNASDNCQYTYNPAQGDDCLALPEVEPNDYLEEAHTVVLPAAIVGVVAAPVDIEDPDFGFIESADLDTFMFSGRAGSLYQVIVVADPGSELIPVVTVYRDEGLLHRTVAGSFSEHVLVEFFAPLTGNYNVLVTDARNISDPSLPTGGESGFGYNLYIAEKPVIPILATVGDRVSRTLEFPGALEIFEIEVPASRLFTARTWSGTLAPRADLDTLPRIWSVTEGRELRYAASMVGADRSEARAWVNTQAGGRLWVVADYRMAFADNDLRYDLAISLSDPDREQENNHGYQEAFPLVIPQTMQGTIGAPFYEEIMGAKMLVEDMDYFFFEADAGSLLRFEFDNSSSTALLDPYLLMPITYRNRAGNRLSTWYEGFDSSGQDAAVEMLVPSSGYHYAILRETHNIDADEKSGSAAHTYTLATKAQVISATPIAALPYTATRGLAGGGRYDFFSLSANPGELLTVRVTPTSSNEFTPEIILYGDKGAYVFQNAAGDIETPGADNSEIVLRQFFAESHSDLLLAVREMRGGGAPGFYYDLSVDSAPVGYLSETEENGEIATANAWSNTSQPILGHLDLLGGDTEDYFGFSVQAGDVLAITAGPGVAPHVYRPRIKLLDATGARVASAAAGVGL